MTDHELLEQFFRSAREQEITDNGFSARVMQQIAAQEARQQSAARRAARLSRLWTGFCIAVAAVLFVLLRGWIPLAQAAFNLFTTPPTVHRLLMLVITACVLFVLMLNEVIRRERMSAI